MHPNRSSSRIRTAAVLLLVQGILMELSAFVALPILLLLQADLSMMGNYFRFIVPYFQENLFLLMGMSGIFGVLRVIGAVAMWRDLLWGLALSVVMCAVTLVLMIFMLPAGIAAGILSGGALILILRAWFGSARISDRLPD